MNKSDDGIADLLSSGDVNGALLHNFENVYYRRKSRIATGNVTSFEFESLREIPLRQDGQVMCGGEFGEWED